VVLRNQHTNLAIAKGKTSPRITANRQDQVGAMATARSAGAKNVNGFGLINGYSATVTNAQASALASNPNVAAVYPDLPIKTAPTLPRETAAKSASASDSPTSSICPSNPAKPLLEPEALAVTNTAFSDTSKAQAQNIVTGTGVKVGWIADGIDVNNPDFIRANGQHVFADYQDFSGEGPNAPSDAAEAFGDASAIAAQGRQVYDLADFVSAAHPLPAGCNITVRGVAPGATLYGLKVFGNANTAPTSRFIQAIQYAVNTDGVDVLNESFGGNPFPDNGDDPITLADLAAVAAGVTVVSSTGDAGTAGTIGSPSSTTGIIAAGATTTFQSYLQTGFAGSPQFSNGTWVDNNISSLSSGGITQTAGVPNLVAPGDLGWALCSPNPAIYEGCVADNGTAASIQNFGGTSQASPLTSGAAALVINAYKNTHHGVRPSPQLVERFLTSTTTDLGSPAYEQGAGLLNTLGAVKAAESYKDANGSPKPTGNTLLPAQSQYSVFGYPHSTQTTSVTVTNDGSSTQSVKASTRTIGKNVSDQKGTVTLNTATAPTYVDEVGTLRSYVKKTFKIKAADRLSVSAAADNSVSGSPIRIILISPKGVYTAYSIPQGIGNFANVDVQFPIAGTWTAIFAASQAFDFNGPVAWEASTANFTTHGSVSPSSFSIAPGKSKTVKVSTPMGSNPGDVSSSLQLVAGGHTTSIPVTARTVLPPYNDTFKGTITGGNGRAAGGVAQSNVYYLDVPKGKKDLSIGVTFPDGGMIVNGFLTAPDGQVYSYQTNVNAEEDALFNGFQIYRRNPQAGRWTFSMEVTNPVSGAETSQPFVGRVRYNTVQISAPALPNSAKTKLAAGVPVTVPVKIKNTGVIPLTYFADGRLNATGTIPLAELSGNSTVQLPVAPGITPFWLVPSEASQLSVIANADQPVTLDVFYASGEPDRASNPLTIAGVLFNATQVSPGEWGSDIGQTGPFAGPAPTGSASVAATAFGKLFDPAVTSSTGDFWQAGLAPSADVAATKVLRTQGFRTPWTVTSSVKSGKAAGVKAAVSGPPVDLPPGATTTIMVTITPSGTAGSVVKGHLYIDTLNEFSASGDELIDLPYQYTIS
jgi:hypothetical protein